MSRRMHTGPQLSRSILAVVVACAAMSLVVVAPAAAAAFSNPAAITTTLPSCGGAPAPATPYPSPIAVSGLTGTVSDVNVTLRGMSNDWGGDFEIFLVSPGPNPRGLVLMSDAGAATLSNYTVTFDDSAASALPQNSLPASPSTVRPADYQELVGPGAPADTYPNAPAGPGKPAPTGSATLASTFNGIAPNGLWNLYVLNDACDAPAETIGGGWTLDITTAAGAATTTVVTSSTNPSSTGSNVVFSATVTSSRSPVTSGTVTFSEGATTLAANVALDVNGVATFSKSNLAEGNHVITATYNGVAAFNTSNGSVNQVVNTATTVSGTTFCNAGPIAVRPSSAIPSTTPYPSNLTVSGVTGTIATVTAQLKNVGHPFAEDIDVLLVGPNPSNNLVLVSDAGSGATNNVTLNVSDVGASLVPATGPWAASGSTVTARPTDYTPVGDIDTFPSALPPASPTPGTLNRPAPTGSATLASAFGGSSPNGSWSLYVRDDGAPDVGSIAGGWCLTITAAAPPTFSSADTATFATGTAGSFTVTATGTPAPALAVTGTLPPGVTFNPATGVLAGTPAGGSGGTYPLTFTASNGVAPDATQSFTLTVNQAVDVTPPTVTTDQAIGQPDPTSVSPVAFTVIFSEPVTGFTSADVTFSGSSATGPLSALVTGTGPTYSVAVSGMTTSGTVVAGIPAGSVLDLNGNPNAASTSADNTVLYRSRQSLPAVVSGSVTWKLGDSLTAGAAISAFTYGARPTVPLSGDWDGDGTKTPGSFEGGMFKLRNSNSAGTADVTFSFGDPRGFPVAGDWNGDGIDDVAVFRAGVWQTRLSGSGTTATFSFGPALSWPTVVPVAGDWDGDGIDGVGLYNLSGGGTLGEWSLRQTASSGAADLTFVFGGSGQYPVVGDWNADGTDGVGTKNLAGSGWSLRNTASAGAAELSFAYGAANDLPLTWRN